MKKVLMFFAASLVLMGGLVISASADTLSPSTVTATIGVGGTVSVDKTFTVSAGTPTTAKGDVFFLCDTTGSMGGVIGSVITNASTILSSAAGLGDVSFGVGEYKDNGDVYVYRKNADIGSAASAQTGINMWSASGGGDTPEANLYALQQVADTTTWRTATKKIVLWFGDASGHDPSGPTGVTEAQATAALQAKSILVEAMNTGNLNATGQASRIAAATGGAYYASVNPATIVADIQAALVASFATYNVVALGLPTIDGLEFTVTPLEYSIPDGYSRETENIFGFDLDIKGTKPGVYEFDIYGLLDGGATAVEHDIITVRGTEVPEPTTMLLLGFGLLGLAGARRKF